ncbi:MAG: TRAP transporter substrate-binding protein DctP [Roseovarius sp.]|nr:TRAP transporter substrate-binding protein DctP [Roseovarius sp.]
MKTILTLGAAMAVLAAPVAHAQQVTLRVADSFPVGHYIAEKMTKPFMDQVAERSNGAVTFEYFPAEQLGKARDLMDLTLSGVTDIGYVAPSFVSDKLPLSVVAELPEGFTSACEGTRAYWEMAREGGLLDQLEFEPNGVRALFVLVLPPYQIYMTPAGAALEGLHSFSGQKIRTSGGAKEIAIRKLDAVPVQIPTPEVREAAARGTIDGFLFPHSSVPPYDLQRHATAATVGLNFGSFVATYMISRDRWAQLPQDVRDAMTEVGNEIVEAGCRATEEMEADDIALIEAAGTRMVEFPEQDKERLKALMAEVSQEWAANLDGRGLRGSEVLGTFQELLSR